MCGIAGYLNLSGSPVNPDGTLLVSMLETITHRGPDDSGLKIIGPVALGMTRLSIIDLTTGHQPISNEDGTIWIVFNGEIYNYRKLQELVLEKGHTLATRSDTEVIIHLYEEFGVDCLTHLEGMFAFAIWDDNKKSLFIARDRMGEKPLHYGVFGGKLVFGSEIKELLVHPDVPRRLNRRALQMYLALEYVPAPQSIFEGIRKLKPGHYLLAAAGNVVERPYWSLPKSCLAENNTFDYKAKLRDELIASITGRLIADVPLGVFLSGGIDSSLIAALSAPLVSGRLKTFSIGFSDPSFDESAHARLVSEHLSTEHEMAVFSPSVALDTVCELFSFLDEPLADASVIPTYYLSKMTRSHVTVALAGEGGDELFGGYPTYVAHNLAFLYNRLPEILRRDLIKPMVEALPVSLNNLSFDYKAKRFVSSVSLSPGQRHLSWMGAFPMKEQVKMLRIDSLELTSTRDLLPESVLESGFLHPMILGVPSNGGDRQSLDLVAEIMRLDLSTYLPDDLLVKSDRASMAASLEVRLPFLAFPLVEFAQRLPSTYKIRGKQTKILLRQLAADYLPESIIKRPKKGFGIPVGKWMKGELKSLADELFSEGFLRSQAIFELRYIEKLRKEHEEGRFDRRKELWTLFMFQWWWKKYFQD